MKWSPEAVSKIKRVPFFIRPMVKKKVEAYARENGISEIRVEHINTLKERFMKDQEDEIKGFSLDTCLGADGCKNRFLGETDIADRLENLLMAQDLKAFLKERIKGPLKMHNEFRVSISFCPNSCSRPQIVDIGLIGAVRPKLDPEICDGCGACIKVCKENAITLNEKKVTRINEKKCLYCGSCIKACKNSAITRGKEGFRILVGGKLGRHPQLGLELDHIFSTTECIKAVEKVLSFYKKRASRGERLGALLDYEGLRALEEGLNIPFKGNPNSKR